MANYNRIFSLIHKDWLDLFASKSWIIVLVLPLFITFIYAVVYRGAETQSFTLAYTTALSPKLTAALSTPNLKLVNYPNLAAAKHALATEKVAGVIIELPNAPNRPVLLVSKTKTKEAIVIVNAINVALLQLYSRQSIPQFQLIFTNESLAIRWLSLPVWLIQVILTVCLLQAAAAIADEKERQTLHSLLISPISFGDYLLSKLAWNSLVGTGAILLTLALTKAPLNLGMVISFGILGCMVYTAISIVIGLFSPSALFSRTLATLAYIISALPLMVRDLSFFGKIGLKIFPSFLILLGFERSLQQHPYSGEFFVYALILTLETILILGITHFILNNKADF